ncbi:MAG: two-component regulator propeller domain-containing protein [Breznakibacter sp.]
MQWRLLSLFLFIYYSTFASNINNIQFEHYNDGDGLTHNSVRHIVQDPQGFLWIGTFGGVNRFDGYQFKPYLNLSRGSNKIGNNDITALLLDDSRNDLWIGTSGGLVRYQMDKNLFTSFLPQKENQHPIPDAEIRSLYLDPFKRLWVGTKTKGLGLFDVETGQFQKINIDGFDYVKVIYGDSRGRIWVGSYITGGVAQITLTKSGEVGHIKTYTIESPYSKDLNPYINFIYEDDKSDLFIGTREGLYKWDKLKDTFEELPFRDKSMQKEIGLHYNSVARSPQGRYWVGTLGGLLSCNHLEDISQGNFDWHYSVLSETNSLVDNMVFALLFDKSGVLWIGTENGLDKYDPFANQFIVKKDISALIGGKVPRISGFAKTFDNKLIVATHAHGLFWEHNNRFEKLYNDQKDIASIYSFDGKTFYCGLWNGKILIFNYLKNSWKTLDVGFKGIPIFAFHQLPSGNILIGSFGQGIIEFNPGTQSVQSSSKKILSDQEINRIISNPHGLLWIATEKGIFSYDQSLGKLNTYTHHDNDTLGLSSNNVSDIYIDPKGKVWAVTRVGLNYYDPVSDDFIPVLEPEELHSNWITNLVADNNNSLWLNFNNNRIAKYNTTTNELSMYHVKNGNRLDVFSLSGFSYFDDHHLYLGGENGIIFFSPKELQNNTESFKPFITDFRIQNKEVEVGQNINGQIILTQDINTTKSVELYYWNRNFSFTFSCPSYVKENFNHFMYKLEGFDKEWITADVNQRNIQYTNLFFGDYTFKLKAQNSHGYWSEEATYDIRILPPVWLTWKAYLAYLILLIVTYLMFRQVTRRQIKLKHQLALERVKREKDEKLNDEKLRFFTNISHELRTPLTLILGPAKQMLAHTKDKTVVNHSQLIVNNTTRLLNLVNQILDFRKSQEGSLQLKVTHAEIVSYTLNIFNSFKPFAAEKEIAFEFKCDEKTIHGWIDTDKYDKVLYNLLSNAFKFTNRQGRITLHMSVLNENGRHCRIEVKDNGIGIPIQDQEKIFSRFFQATNSPSFNTGSGIGLSLAESLTKVHRGKIEMKSEPGKGSKFSVTIPIDKEAYPITEIFDLVPSSKGESNDAILPEPKAVDMADEKEKILIVEDNTELRKFEADYLSQFYEVVEAENGREGIDLCKSVMPIICVVDVMMPVMDGYEFCSTLKNDEEISHIPVILLTALTEDENKIKGYKAGADGYLGKPFDLGMLKVQIESIVANRKALKQKFSNEANFDVAEISHSPADDKFLEKINTILDEHLIDQELNVNKLCSLLNVSSSNLYRKIKELTDLSPNEFIRTIRLKKASELLKVKDYNVSEVAYLVGFADPLYFSRCFKKQFGVSPRDYQ